MDNRSSKIVILAGFLLVLLMLGSIMMLSIFSIKNNSLHISHLVEDQIKGRDIFIMRDAAQKRALLLYRMITIDDPFEMDALRQQFSDLAGKFIGARERLIASLDHDEQTLWDVLRHKVAEGSKAQSDAIKLILAGKKEEAYELLRKRVIPVQDSVRLGLTRLLDKTNVHINKELDRANQGNFNDRLAMLAMGGVAFLFGILAMLYVLRYNARTERLLIEQQRLANEASRAKTNFLANMSHEIRTPLTAIIGFSDSLAGNDIEKSEREEYQRSVTRNSRHLLQLVNDILDISKIESGQLDIEQIPASSFSLANEIKSILGTKASDKGLEFHIKYHYPLPEAIITDPVRLKQILINLCGNAIKFTDRGGVSVDIITDLEKETMTFRVSDTGIGMSQEELDRIFQPFAQADSTTTRKYGGTGLGLAISQQLADKMGGFLGCSSARGEGSVFELVLPTGSLDGVRLVESGGETGQSEQEQIDTQLHALKGNILLAEDSTDNQLLISMYARKTGAHIVAVSNGQDAVEEATAGNYDLILMDVQMPVMDGIEAIRRLRQDGYDRPIVTLTANATQGDRQKSLDAGADDFLVKPIDTGSFYSVLNRYLERDEETVIAENPMAAFLGDRFQKLVQGFLDKLPDSVKEIGSAVEAKDWETVAKTAHKLKGTGGNFGFPKISELADGICELCKQEAFGRVPAKFTELDAFCRSIVNTDKREAG